LYATFLLSLIPPPPSPTLFPYTTLFRSKSFIRGVLEQATDQVGHSGKEFTDGAIFADAITHFHQCALDWSSHPIEQLKLEAAAIDSELLRERLCMSDAPNIVRAKCGGNDGFIFQQ